MKAVLAAHRERLDAPAQLVHAGEGVAAVVGLRGDEVVLARHPERRLGDGPPHGLVRGVLADEVDDAGPGRSHVRVPGRLVVRSLAGVAHAGVDPGGLDGLQRDHARGQDRVTQQVALLVEQAAAADAAAAVVVGVEVGGDPLAVVALLAEGAAEAELALVVPDEGRRPDRLGCRGRGSGRRGPSPRPPSGPRSSRRPPRTPRGGTRGRPRRTRCRRTATSPGRGTWSRSRHRRSARG